MRERVPSEASVREARFAVSTCEEGAEVRDGKAGSEGAEIQLDNAEEGGGRERGRRWSA